jgi:DNA-binding MarR family transcriptional regulator
MTEDGAGEFGPLFFDVVRFWSKRSTPTGDNPIARQGRLVLVVEAVRALTPIGQVTVNSLAQEIGIDQSGASRLVQDAVKEGYLHVAASSNDGRQRQISLTATGLAMLGHAREWQSSMVLSLTSDWSVSERERFAHALQRLLTTSRKNYPT